MELVNTKDELEWSAFCYAAGEMSPADAAAFEQRLAEDQTAREALARAVELTEVVATAESLEPLVTVRSQSTTWSRRVAWMAIGSAASVLAVLLWTGAGSWLGSGKPAGGELVSADQHELAIAWALTRVELSASDTDVAASDADSGAEAGGDDGQEFPMPDWLTAAVESYATDPGDPDKTPFDGERREN